MMVSQLKREAISQGIWQLTEAEKCKKKKKKQKNELKKGSPAYPSYPRETHESDLTLSAKHINGCARFVRICHSNKETCTFYTEI